MSKKFNNWDAKFVLIPLFCAVDKIEGFGMKKNKSRAAWNNF